MSVQHIWNLFQLLGLKCANTIPKLPGVDYVAKNWTLAMMLKALPLVHFWGVLLLKEQMITSVRKTLKTLVSNWFLAKFALKITTKLAVFYRLLFGEVCPEPPVKLPPNRPIFLRICPEKSREICLFLPRPVRRLKRTTKCVWNIVFCFVYRSVEHAFLVVLFHLSKLAHNIFLDL